MPKLIDDCFAHDQPSLRHDEALALLRERVRPVVGAGPVDLWSAAGRVLADPVAAPRPIPAHANAAVDGYAFAFDGYDVERGSQFRVDGRSAAGRPHHRPVIAGGAIRIFTGAVMPEGADTVVMQEDVRRDGDLVLAPSGLKRGANCRMAGEDAREGAVLLRSGARLRPQDVASAAATGLTRIHCFDRLKVAIFSTGDEVVRPPARLKPGHVYDANAPMLAGLIESVGARCTDLGVLPDDPETLRAALADAAAGHQVLVSSGGASVGDEDHFVRALDALGRRHLWRIAIKPGRPMTFGQVGDCVVLGLPGNPVSAFVCFLLYVRPVLMRLGGADWPEPRRFPIPAGFSADKKAGRREFWRGMLTEQDGRLVVAKFPRDGSGLISSLTAADGLIEAAEEVTRIETGEPVSFLPFGEFGLPRA